MRPRYRAYSHSSDTISASACIIDLFHRPCLCYQLQQIEPICATVGAGRGGGARVGTRLPPPEKFPTIFLCYLEGHVATFFPCGKPFLGSPSYKIFCGRPCVLQ